jgi:hypothetical protein
MLADGGEVVADLAVLRDQSALFGPVASDRAAATRSPAPTRRLTPHPRPDEHPWRSRPRAGPSPCPKPHPPADRPPTRSTAMKHGPSERRRLNSDDDVQERPLMRAAAKVPAFVPGALGLVGSSVGVTDDLTTAEEHRKV